MPAWWKRKSKSSSKSKSPAAAAYGKKEKASSFDGIVAAGSSRGDVFVFGSGHPLPRPCTSSSPLPSIPRDHGNGAGCASTSSDSSSGLSDDAPDLGFYRYSDTINMPRGRTMVLDSPRQHHAAEYKRNPVLEYGRCSGVSVSPKKKFWLYSSDPSPNGTSHRASSRGQPFSSAPVQQRAFCMCPGSPTERQDDMRNSPHPLPLPPSFPTSSSRPLQSQWKKGKLLGQGTFGHVYLGFSSDSGQMCAIKEVKVSSDDSNSKESLKQLNQEIALLNQLVHPNIVQYYGSELDGETLSVYLEYVSGGSIHKLLQEYGPFREPVIRSYAAQILSGLAYLHGRNTMHRDIKGANILVDPSGEIKLADFGMAKHVASYTSIHSLKGSPYWMAPEVIMNSSGYTLSVDIWSLGCTILEMATSKPPWSQFEGVAVIFKIGNSKDIPEIPDHISPEGKHFLKLCLQRDPSARPTAAQLMDHPFVRDQATIKAAKVNMIRDVLPSSSDGTDALITMEFSSNRSLSPLRDRDCGTRRLRGFPLVSLNPSDLSGMRMNMSLPVSPCSSPLRQYRQASISCLQSPPHTAFLAGAVNFKPSNYTLYPTRPSSNFQDIWPNASHMRVSSPYDSPRR